MNRSSILVITPAIAVALVLSGCQPGNVRDTASPFYRVPVGSVFEVNQALAIPPRRARVYFQDGVAGHGYGQYYPFCYFRTREVPESGQTIEPGRFTVTRVRGGSQEVVEDAGPVLVASTVWLAGGDDGGAPSDVSEMVYMYLESDRQPEVMYMACGGGFDHPAEALPPSIDEIRAALGKLVTLTLP